EQSLFKVPKPNVELGIGFDMLPSDIRNSKVLTGNQLALLANVTEIPSVDPNYSPAELKQISQYFSINPDEMEKELHQLAAKHLNEGKIDEAWQVLLSLNT